MEGFDRNQHLFGQAPPKISWQSKGTPRNATPPENKAAIKGFLTTMIP